MEKQVVRIYCLSGTGNTRFVAGKLMGHFKQAGLDCTVKDLSEVTRGQVAVELPQGAMLGIGHPILGFDAGRLVYRFIQMLPNGKGRKAFVFKSGADPSIINHGASRKAIRMLERKGYDVIYEQLFAMPCNFVVAYPERLARQLCDAVDPLAGQMVRAILAGRRHRDRINWLVHMITQSVNLLERFGARIFGKDLKAGDSCNLCGRCIADCPTNNIREQDGTLRFGWQCILCMKCIYQCPRQAIRPRFHRFVVIKKGYNLDAILQSKVRGNFVTGKTRGFFRHFWPYLRQAQTAMEEK